MPGAVASGLHQRIDSASSTPYPGSTVGIASRNEISGSLYWQQAFARERKGHRYYELLEDTLKDGLRGLRFAALVYSTLGVGFSIYFMYLQYTFIHALCIYRFISAMTTLLLFIAAIPHFRATRAHLNTGIISGHAIARVECLLQTIRLRL